MRRLFVLLAVIAAACAQWRTGNPACPDMQDCLSSTSSELDIEATVLAAYNVVSGPAGRRDWDRFRELFAPSAHLVVNGVSMTPDEFQKSVNDELQKSGLFEHPVATRIDRAGDIAQVWTRYESRHATTEQQPFAHGARSFQLVRSGERWLIASVLMQAE